CARVPADIVRPALRAGGVAAIGARDSPASNRTKSFRDLAPREDNGRVRPFDRKFGADFLASVPSQPGVYRLYDATGALLYVGTARNLRRRLAQYRTTRHRKKDRKRRALVRSADRIAWEVCESELDASLAEIRLIQALRPSKNVAGAFPFLYPFIG